MLCGLNGAKNPNDLVEHPRAGEQGAAATLTTLMRQKSVSRLTSRTRFTLKSVSVTLLSTGLMRITRAQEP